jgi:hypothetical protein
LIQNIGEPHDHLFLISQEDTAVELMSNEDTILPVRSERTLLDEEPELEIEEGPASMEVETDEEEAPPIKRARYSKETPAESPAAR